MLIKPYQQIQIRECGEPLVEIPLELFAVESPHPYEKLGAPYGKRSPYYLRQSVLERLIEAQNQLQQRYPGWRIQIFDAYRPVEVQQFMVDYTFNEVVEARKLNAAQLSLEQRQEIWQQVYQFWAVPNLDPAMPPPHSTGAAVDVTLVDDKGSPLEMGSAIDELGARSHPNYYAQSNSTKEQQYHADRQLLHTIMLSGEFCRHPNEWWHFSFGDQMWAWQSNQENLDQPVTARYGRVIDS